MGQFLRRPVRDVRDGPGRRDHLGIGGHDARDIGPDLHPAGVDAHGEKRGRIVGAAPSQGGDPAVRFLADETRHDKKLHVRIRIHGLGYTGVGLRLIHGAVLHLHQFPGIQPLAGDAQGTELVRQDGRGKQFAEAFDGILRGRAQFAQQENPVGDSFQRIEERIDRGGGPLLVSVREQFPDDGVMTFAELGDERFVGLVLPGGPAAGFDQCVGAAAHGGGDHDGTVRLQGFTDDVDYPEHRFR